MPRKGHSPEQVLNKLRQVEVAVAGGKSVGQAVRLNRQSSCNRCHWPEGPQGVNATGSP
jgi:cytochrome c551/c552